MARTKAKAATTTPGQKRTRRTGALTPLEQRVASLLAGRRIVRKCIRLLRGDHPKYEVRLSDHEAHAGAIMDCKVALSKIEAELEEAKY